MAHPKRRKSFKCSHCKFSAPSEEALKFHKFRHQDTEGRVQKRKDTMHKYYPKIKCSKCDFKASSGEIKRHLETHNPTQNTCNICERILPTKNGLQRHMRSQHRDKEFKCNICNYTAKNSSLLCLHKKGVHGTEYHECDMCDKKFKI